jgi:tetratricopeptide (TPR) repeat protein
MSDPTDAADGHDDMAAGWLLAWKALLASGAAVPDLARVDLPPELSGRLRRGAECLGRLHQIWPADPAPGPSPAEQVDTSPLPSIGRFRVRRELGRGGFGVVYLAHDPTLDRDVAVKVPHARAGLDSESGHRLAVEAQAAARLGHPNIVPVYEAGTADGVPYVVSAYCPGISLADWVARTSAPVPWRDAVGVVAALARGIHHAHARGVLHRDIKPANVLLVVADPDAAAAGATLHLTDFVPRITDFGLARLPVESCAPHTVSGLIQGTPAYMAPEQAAGRPRDVTTAVDVYSLGAILYETLLRRPPFVADTPLAILDMLRTEPPPRPRTLRADLPPDLETICLKCLDKDPGRRYASAEDLAEDLGRLSRGEPVLARRVGRLERLRRSIRRHPAVAGLSALLVLSLVAGLVVTTALLQRTRRERDRAGRHFAQALEVIQQMVGQADSAEFRTHEMRPLRERLLHDLSDRFERLASQLNDDAADRPLSARCQLELCGMLFNAGRVDEARVAAARAVAAYEQLVRERPDDPVMKSELATALMRLAYTQGDSVLQRRTAERAEEVNAAYLALPENVRGVAASYDAAFASYYYDLAVTAAARSDSEAARHFLTAAGDRLRPLCADGSPARRRTLPLFSRVLQFRCQIERHGGRPREAAEAGREALACAQEVCRGQPDKPQHWSELGDAYNEYGLALEAVGQPQRAIDVWTEGYDRLGGDVTRSPGWHANAIARQGYLRLMIAYNLGLGFARRIDVASSERWFRTSLDLARHLLFVLPNERELWYMRGMCCVNLANFDKQRPGRSTGHLPLHSEGLTCLETALRLKPDDHQLRSDLGLCWHRYTVDLTGGGEGVAALAAASRAVAHQAAAVSAAPDNSVWRNRLTSHLAQAGEVATLLFSGVWGHVPQSSRTN